MFENVDKLPDGPWVLTGSYMPADIRTVEVTTVNELAQEMTRMLELSPTTEVIVSKKI